MTTAYRKESPGMCIREQNSNVATSGPQTLACKTFDPDCKIILLLQARKLNLFMVGIPL